MKKIVVLVSGGGTNLQALMDAIDNGTVTNAGIAAVISNNKNAYALERAAQRGICAKCLPPGEFGERAQFNEALLKEIDSYEPDLVILAGYLVIIPECVIRKYKGRMINIHPSLIPAFCGKGFYGLRVHEGVLERGCKITGATVHFVDEGTDTGPIILQKAVAVHDDDTPETLQKRVMREAEWLILPEAVNLLANDRVLIENNRVKLK